MLFTGPRLRSDDGQWTDNPAFLNAALATAQFAAGDAGSGRQLRPAGVPVPPLGPRASRGRRSASPMRWQKFLLALPRLYGSAYAVEVRDPELLTDDYLAAPCVRAAQRIASQSTPGCRPQLRRGASGATRRAAATGGAVEPSPGMKYEKSEGALRTVQRTG